MPVDDYGLQAISKSAEEVTPGDKSNYYLKVGVVSGSIAGTSASAATIYNLSAPSAGTEYSQALPAGTKAVEIRVRGLAEAKFSFTSGESGSTYKTIPKGCSWSEYNLSMTGKTVYIQTNKPSQTIEITAWV